jgi:hypothetical protein
LLWEVQGGTNLNFPWQGVFARARTTSLLSAAVSARPAQLCASISYQSSIQSPATASPKSWARNVVGSKHFGIRSASTFKTAYEAHVSERASQVSFVMIHINFIILYPFDHSDIDAGCRSKADRCEAMR